MTSFPLLASAPPAAPAGAPTSAPAGAPAQDVELPHPALWHAHRLGRERLGVLSTGFTALDVELPGGGWPLRTLTELLLPRPGVGELRLLAPTLRTVQNAQHCVMLVDPPAPLQAWAWQGLGLQLGPGQLVIVQRRPNDRVRGALRERLPAADMLWAAEQALASGHLGALLAWLPARLPADALRRLQLAAQAHDGPVFLLRDTQARLKPSPAPLRLSLAAAGPDALELRLFKRRGPALARPLVVALAPVLSGPAAARVQTPSGAPHAVDRHPSAAAVA